MSRDDKTTRTGSGTKSARSRRDGKTETEIQDVVKPRGSAESQEETGVLETHQAATEVVGMTGPARLKEILDELRSRDKITADDGTEIDFDTDTKEYFIGACEAAYPIIEQTLNSMYEMGRSLHGVRDRLKPKKLYYTWLEFTGIPRRTAHNYVQAYERFQDRLPEYSHLGIKKLLITARLPDCTEYVDKNLQRITTETAAELEQEVKALLARNRTKGTGRGRKPSRINVGKYVIRPSLDGKKLTIEGMSEKKRAQLIETIKVLLLQENE